MLLPALMDATLFPGLTELLLTALVFMSAQAMYAVFGFGAGMLSVSLLAFVLPDLSGVVALLLLANIPTEVWILWKDRSNIHLGGARSALAGMVVGTPAGALLLWAGAGQPILVRVLGAVVVVFGAWLVWDARRTETPSVRLPRGSGVVAGLVGGVLGGLFGTGGPPLILYLQLEGLAKRDFRATLIGLFLIMGLVRLPVYVATGLIDTRVVLSTLCVVPAGLVGLVVGSWIHTSAPERGFRQGVGVLLGILGVLLMLR